MHRRRYLSVGTAALLAGLAGCTDGLSGTADTPTSGAAPPDEDGAVVASNSDLDLPVSREALTRGAAPDAIPAIVDPVFGADWSGVTVETVGLGGDTIEPRLRDDDRVVGVVREGVARAYPLRILNWHEVVNDAFGGPLLVTYCPLCGSAVVAVREAGCEETTFGVSGLLWRNDLVMYDDATDSLWSQIVATAIRGELTGETLDLVPSTLTTWREWRTNHPETVVLRPPPESDTVSGKGTRNYTRNPYRGYDESDRVGIRGEFDDDRLHPKTQVVGVAHDGAARAYPTPSVQETGVINDAVGGLPVVVTAVDGTPVAYVREVGGEVVEFAVAGDRHLSGAGSQWRRSSGDAIDGPHEGTRLDQANDVSAQFWFAWVDFHPETDVFEG